MIEKKDAALEAALKLVVASKHPFVNNTLRRIAGAAHARMIKQTTEAK